MDLDLAAQPGRAAGSDAERRAALALARALRSAGREAHVDTFWTRPAREAPQAVCAGLAAVASVVSADHPRAGLALAAAALALALAEAAGVPVLRALLAPRRATQSVVSPAPRTAPVTLVLTAAVDGARGGLVRRLPAPLAWQLGALLALVACAAGRALGAEGVVFGAVQLVPTTALVLLAAGWAEAALAPPARDASAPAVVLEVVRALDRRPPRRLAVEVVLSGDGAGGLRRRRRRDGRPPEAVALVHVEPCAAGAPSWRRGAHRQLARAAARAAAAERRLGARAVRGRAPARLRAPAIAVGARPPGEGGPRAVAAFVLALVAELDRELAAGD